MLKLKILLENMNIFVKKIVDFIGKFEILKKNLKNCWKIVEKFPKEKLRISLKNSI